MREYKPGRMRGKFALHVVISGNTFRTIAIIASPKQSLVINSRKGQSCQRETCDLAFDNRAERCRVSEEKSSDVLTDWSVAFLIFTSWRRQAASESPLGTDCGRTSDLQGRWERLWFLSVATAWLLPRWVWTQTLGCATKSGKQEAVLCMLCHGKHLFNSWIKLYRALEEHQEDVSVPCLGDHSLCEKCSYEAFKVSPSPSFKTMSFLGCLGGSVS